MARDITEILGPQCSAPPRQVLHQRPMRLRADRQVVTPHAVKQQHQPGPLCLGSLADRNQLARLHRAEEGRDLLELVEPGVC